MRKSEIKHILDPSDSVEPGEPSLHFVSCLGDGGQSIAEEVDCCQPDEWDYVRALSGALYYAWDDSRPLLGQVYVGEFK